MRFVEPEILKDFLEEKPTLRFHYQCRTEKHFPDITKGASAKRKQNDWKAVEELTEVLREMDPEDPVKYDYALFGLGIFEGF